MRPIYSDKRQSGIPLIGNLPWGTDFCQFYQTEKDLIEILVPYFRAGLESNELCVWITSGAFSAEDARKALKNALPHFNEYVDKGQMEIIPQRRWRAQGEKTNETIVSKLDKAVLNGFDGLRLACNAFPGRRSGKAFTFDGVDVISRYNVLAVFSYPRDKFDAVGLMEAVKNHRFALVRNADCWELIESSEVRTIKDALKRSEEKLHSLFSNMSEGFAYHRIVLDAKGGPCDYIFYEVNDAFDKLTGLKGENIIGKRVTEVLPGIENDPTDWIGKCGQVALTGKPMQFENYSESLDKWYSVSAYSPHKGYFAVTFSDITERKQAEQDLRKAHDELELRVQERTSELQVSNKALMEYAAKLEKLNEELQDFAFVASHDLQEPLRKILTFSGMAIKRCEPALDSKAKEYLDRVINSAKRMRQLLHDLLQFSRVATKPESFKEIDLGKMAREAANLFEEDLRQSGGLIEIKNLPHIEADETQMLRLFQNLIGNALKFRGKENPRIKIYARDDGQPWEIFVKDNGIGFDPQFAERIFKPFQKLHGRKEYEGTGMGLAICRKIVEWHGGTIRAESRAGKGSTFIVRMPVKRNSREGI
ncbi:MAG: ATP-binding protein [Deltaproteobacteria bacterium]